MSNLASMSYKTFFFSHNPVKLTVKDEKSLKETALPFFGTHAENLGQKKRRVIAEGWLIGEDCWQQWEKLCSVCTEDSPGALRLPWQQPFLAVAEQLQLLGAKGAQALKYSVTFVEWQQPTAGAPVTYTAKQGDSLWDIAYQSQKSLRELLAVNTHIRDIDCLNAGEQVVIPC